MATAVKCSILIAVCICSLGACNAEKPTVQKKAEPIVAAKPKRPVLTPEQRRELGFPASLISQMELAAGAEAEPFFVTVMVRSENLKGENGFEKESLAGFSVRTKNAEDIITSFRTKFHAQRYLVFRSRKSYGTLPDVVTVIRGTNSYDILKVQRTEAPTYHLTTNSIIVWLKARQREGSFIITGAGPDWIDAKFIRRPRNMRSFARKVAAFAPDVFAQGPPTVEKLAERMKRMNGFSLVWD